MHVFAGASGQHGIAHVQPFKVLVSEDLGEAANKQINDLPSDLVEITHRPDMTPDELSREIEKFQALIIRGGTKVNEKLLSQAPHLEFVGRAGNGTDNIDKDALQKRGVKLCNTPDANVNSTAELAITLILNTARNVSFANQQIKNGIWDRSAHMGCEIQGKTLGIIGTGKIGNAVAEKAKALGMKVIGTPSSRQPTQGTTQSSNNSLETMRYPFGKQLNGRAIWVLKRPIKRSRLFISIPSYKVRKISSSKSTQIHDKHISEFIQQSSEHDLTSRDRQQNGTTLHYNAQNDEAFSSSIKKRNATMQPHPNSLPIQPYTKRNNRAVRTVNEQNSDPVQRFNPQHSEYLQRLSTQNNQTMPRVKMPKSESIHQANNLNSGFMSAADKQNSATPQMRSTPSQKDSLYEERLTKKELIQKAHFISVHVPLTPHTLNLLSADDFKEMGHSPYIINCSRGGVINEADLLEALESGRVAGAGIDTFVQESPQEGSVSALLANHERVVATPHIGGQTHEASENMGKEMAVLLQQHILLHRMLE